MTGAERGRGRATPDWSTVKADKHVLVLVRNPASVSRLMDIVPILAQDYRVAFTFTVDDGSAFSGPLVDYLVGCGAVVEDWATALKGEYDLALTASDNGDLHEIRVPLIGMPHGAGLNRLSLDQPGVISGLNPESLVHKGKIVLDTLVVSHENQIDTVRAVAPELVPRVLVAGDPSMDRIRASMASRSRYRAALGAEGRRLVLLCSTWGRNSLLAGDTDLPAWVAAQLPADHNRVVLVLHPNIRNYHGDLQVDAWLKEATRSGVAVVPSEQGWHAAIVAADVVISDHGSLSSYAVGAGRPVLLAADGGPEVVPGSPMARLLERLPRLDVASPLHPQLDDAMARGDIAGDIAETIFSRPGQAITLLRQRIYTVLGLKPRRPIVIEPAPPPVVRLSEPDAFDVEVRADGTRLVMLRYPVVEHLKAENEDRPEAEDRSTGRHRVARADTSVPGTYQRVAVVWSEEPEEPGELLIHWPGARVAICGSVAMLRDGTRVEITGSVPTSVAGSAVYWWDVRNRRENADQRWEIDVGANSGTLTLSVAPPAPRPPEG
ncbi:hypothetical protein [Kutzneria sp. NPDC052558]|uniref:hypothetical protein n=1 Tax=Kutzneria sp. NPDC052558 TaxID=3364121 RepID=UPI0037CB74DA